MPKEGRFVSKLSTCQHVSCLHLRTHSFYLALFASVAAMAALLVTSMMASMLVMIAALHTPADDHARKIVDRPVRSLYDISTGTSVPFIDDITMQDATSKENIDTRYTPLIQAPVKKIELLPSALVTLLPVRTNTKLYTPQVVRQKKVKRKFGWLVRSKMFRSDLG